MRKRDVPQAASTLTPTLSRERERARVRAGERRAPYQFFVTPQNTGIVVGRMPLTLVRHAALVRNWPALT